MAITDIAEVFGYVTHTPYGLLTLVQHDNGYLEGWNVEGNELILEFSPAGTVHDQLGRVGDIRQISTYQWEYLYGSLRTRVIYTRSSYAAVCLEVMNNYASQKTLNSFKDLEPA